MKDPYELASIRRCFEAPSFSVTGWSLKSFARLGDKIAVSYLLSVPENAIYSISHCEAFARAAVWAFEHPEAASCDRDRTPYFTVFLLKRMLGRIDPTAAQPIRDALARLAPMIDSDEG